ncbi:hypothetical protein D557_3955 [Bordetella holmesii 70147]|nr:hypothetical protein D557_3955 [Bordetella holmesii 70147]
MGESLIIEGRRALARKAQGKRASRPAVDGTHANKTRRPTLGFSPFPAVRHGHGLEAGRAVAATGHRIKHGLSRMQGAPGTVVIAVSAPETALAGAPSAAMALQQLALIPLGECARLVSAASTTQDPPGTCLQISARAQTIASHYRACDRQPSLQARIAIIAHSDITRIQPAMRAGPPQGRAQRYDWQIRAGWVGVAELRSLQGWPGVPPAAPKGCNSAPRRIRSACPERVRKARSATTRPSTLQCSEGHCSLDNTSIRTPKPKGDRTGKPTGNSPCFFSSSRVGVRGSANKAVVDVPPAQPPRSRANACSRANLTCSIHCPLARAAASSACRAHCPAAYTATNSPILSATTSSSSANPCCLRLMER